MSTVNKQAFQQGTGLHQQSVLFSETEFGRQVGSAELLGNRDALSIRHQGEVYFLRQTRAGKLILTK